MGVAEDIVAAAGGGGVAVVRMEIARLVNSAVLRLSARGRVARELAKIADAAARSDADLAAQMDHLGETDKQSATRQLDEALTYGGDDPDEQAATAALREHAEQVHQSLVNHGLIVSGGKTGITVQTNTGQIVRATGDSTVHAPFHVGRDYIAGTESRPRPR